LAESKFLIHHSMQLLTTLLVYLVASKCNILLHHYLQQQLLTLMQYCISTLWVYLAASKFFLHHYIH